MRDSRTPSFVRGCGLAAIVLTTLFAPACADLDSSEARDIEAEELREFLDGTRAIPGPADREEYRHTFARLSVRGAGVRASGLDEESEDGWSPVVERAGGHDSPADVHGWLESGDIDRASSFVPLRSPCERRSAADPAGLPREVAGPEIEARAQRLGCALDRLAERDVKIDWAPGLDRGIVLDIDGGTALVNPRLIALVEPTLAPAAVADGDVGVSWPGVSPAGPSGGQSSSGDEPGAKPLDFDDDNQNHPRPPTTSSNHDSSRTWCDRACDDVWNNACDCNGSPGSGTTTTNDSGCNCNNGAGSSSSGCGFGACKCAQEGRGVKDQAGAFVSILMAGSLVLRRRKKIRVRGRGILSFLIGLVLFVGAARAFAGPPARLVDVRVSVTPAEAAVFVDGNAVAATNGIVRVPAGSHTFSAQLEGYSAAVQNVDVQEKGTGTLVTLRLVADKGYLVVSGSNPALLIAIDGTPVGKGSYSGLVTPGAHIVAAYIPGGEARSYSVTTIAGQSITVSTDAPATFFPPPPPPPPPPPEPAGPKKPEAPRLPPPRGPYFLLNLGLVWQTSRPFGFEHTDTPGPGLAVGGRVGYRFDRILGLDALLEYGRIANGGVVLQTHQIDQNQDGAVTGGEAATDRSKADYTLESLRIGAVLRFTTDGRVNRFVGGVGIGALREMISLNHANLEWDAAKQSYQSTGTYHHHYEGWSPYLLAEGGYERSIQSFLAGLLVQFTLESVSGIDDEPYNSSVQARLGLYLRGGYALW